MRVGKCVGRRSAGLPWERAFVAMVFGGCGGCVVLRSGGVVGSLRDALKFGVMMMMMVSRAEGDTLGQPRRLSPGAPGVSDGGGKGGGVLASVFRGPPLDHN